MARSGPRSARGRGGRRVRRLAVTAGAAALVWLPGPPHAAAQGVRGELRFGGQTLELRPLVRDSLPESEVAGEGLRRRLPDGTLVSCVPNEFCRWFRSGDVTSISVLTQEVRVAAWPGVRGLSVHGHVRGRFGTDDFWPRSGRELEAVAAYVNWDQGVVRVRAGRQYRTDGLGYRNFDGGAVLWRSPLPVRVEAFGGWSLGRGLNAPRTGDLLEEADEFAPDERALVFGGEVTGYWGRRLSLSAVYQREIRTDLLALYSERAAVDARAFVRGVGVAASAEYDIATDEVNEARLRFSGSPLPGVQLSVEGRHYTPFFELWTIWGAFTPAGFNEVSGTLAWSVPRLGLGLRAGGGYRVYEETEAGAGFARLKDSGWRAFGGAGWERNGWLADGGYRAEIGFGAVRLGGDLRLGRAFGEGRFLGLRGTSTQTFGEFRVGEQRVTGGGFEGSWRVGGWTATGGAGLYRVTFDNRPTSPDWTQLRAYAGVGYRFGTEPGLDREDSP